MILFGKAFIYFTNLFLSLTKYRLSIRNSRGSTFTNLCQTLDVF